MQYDIFTGAVLEEGQKLNHITKMCLNCKYLINNNDEEYRCCNEAVMEKGKEKIMASLPDGFEIDTLVLKPMNLKNPSKKCGNYDSDIDKIVAAIEEELK